MMEEGMQRRYYRVSSLDRRGDQRRALRSEASEELALAKAGDARHSSSRSAFLPSLGPRIRGPGMDDGGLLRVHIHSI